MVVTKAYPLLYDCSRSQEERRDGRSTDLHINAKKLPSQGLPSGLSVFWLHAYSCGHSAGFKPASLLGADIATPSKLIYIFLLDKDQ